MKIHDLHETDLFQELSDQEQEVVAGGETWDQNKLQGFLNDTFALIGQYGGFYNNFDYQGFFKSLEQYGFYGPDSSSIGGSTWRG